MKRLDPFGSKGKNNQQPASAATGKPKAPERGINERRGQSVAASPRLSLKEIAAKYPPKLAKRPICVTFVEGVIENGSKEPVTKMVIDFGTERMLNRLFDIPNQPIKGDYNSLAVRAVLNLKLHCNIKAFSLLELCVRNPQFRDTFLKRADEYCRGSTAHTVCFSDLGSIQESNKDDQPSDPMDSSPLLEEERSPNENVRTFDVDRLAKISRQQAAQQALEPKRPPGKSLLARPKSAPRPKTPPVLLGEDPMDDPMWDSASLYQSPYQQQMTMMNDHRQQASPYQQPFYNEQQQQPFMYETSPPYRVPEVPVLQQPRPNFKIDNRVNLALQMRKFG
jgi:hypothetical protein